MREEWLDFSSRPHYKSHTGGLALLGEAAVPVDYFVFGPPDERVAEEQGEYKV